MTLLFFNAVNNSFAVGSPRGKGEAAVSPRLQTEHHVTGGHNFRGNFQPPVYEWALKKARLMKVGVLYWLPFH